MASDRRRPVLQELGRIRRPIDRRIYLAAAGASFVLAFLFWAALAGSGLVDPLFLPSPLKVVTALGQLAEQRKLGPDIGMSVWRVTMGFLIAAVFAIPIGLMIGTFQLAEALLQPMMSFIRYMPAAAFIPLLMLYVGIDEASKMSIIFIGTFFQLVLMVAATARQVPLEMLKVSYTLGASRRHVIGRVIIPASLPGILGDLRITLGWAWTYVVVAELIAADTGLGFRIMESQRFLKTDIIFLYILVIGLLGLAFDLLFRLLEKVLVPWAESFER